MTIKVLTELTYRGKPAPWPLIRAAILYRDSAVCYLCGGPADEVDHVIPRRWGGTEESRNLRACCGPCNKRKGDSIDFAALNETDRCNALIVTRDRITAEIQNFMTIAKAAPPEQVPALRRLARELKEVGGRIIRHADWLGKRAEAAQADAAMNGVMDVFDTFFGGPVG